MKSVNLNCEIITPLFMGGASQQPELRAQSFNGLFRYWFRLLGGSFEDEKKLFGWGGEGAIKGLVQISVIKGQNINTSNFQRNGQGYNYLGFSLALTRRQCINSSQSFKLTFRFHPKTTDEDIKKFLCSVWCAFYLGNFGSRSRRGFGSIVVENINGYIPIGFNLKFKPENDQSIENWLKEQLDFIKTLNYWKPRDDIPYIFENLMWRISNSYADYIQLLDRIGTEYRSFRSGKNIEDRIWLGLPIGKIIPQIGNEKGRRASPLIFKIIEFNNQFEGFILVFKPNKNHDFKFLPDNATLNLKGVNLEKPNWDIIGNFTQTLNNHNIINKIYP